MKARIIIRSLRRALLGSGVLAAALVALPATAETGADASPRKGYTPIFGPVSRNAPSIGFNGSDSNNFQIGRLNMGNILEINGDLNGDASQVQVGNIFSLSGDIAGGNDIGHKNTVEEAAPQTDEIPADEGGQ